jgi:hypothetical protein
MRVGRETRTLMRNAKDAIRIRVDAFVNELSDVVRQATVGEIVEALKEADGRAPVHGPGRQAGIEMSRKERKIAVGTSGRAAKAPIAAPSAGQQRAPELLAQLMERVYSHLKANPGQSMAPLATSLGTSKKDLKLPLRKLVAEKKITSTGKKRGTRYFPR